MPHIFYIVFVFALGSCVGSFLNVVIWRMPRFESIVSPPSHCPKCNTRLAWYDNIPVFGWIALRGKCRYCGQPVSSRYPIIEALTGLLFVGYYVAMFIYQEGPCSIRPMTIEQDWPLYALYMFMIAALLAASLIDAEHYIVPVEIPWIMAVLGLVVHGFIDRRYTPGTLCAGPAVGAMAAGCGTGLIISIVLQHLQILPTSFAEGAPLLEIDKKKLKEQAEHARAEGRAPEAEEEPLADFTRAQLRAEMQKEMLFLIPALALGGLFLSMCLKFPSVMSVWQSVMRYDWLSGFLGALWGAMIGAFIVWFTRILGTLVFGREAMGMGDVHLMFGVGAVIGAAGSAFIFFLAPFIGLLFAVYKWISRQGREVPYVPYLSVATAVILLFYCRIYEHFAPSMNDLMVVLQQKLAGQ